MKKIIVIDAGNDMGHGFLKHMLGDGAIPEALKPFLENFINEGPRDRKPAGKCMWPEQGAFPVSDVRDLILNHLYATAQDGVPDDVVQGIKGELFPLIQGENNLSPEGMDLKGAIIRGSIKKYKTVMPDGTAVEVTVTSPSDLSELSALDALKKLTADAEQALDNKETEKFAKIDLDKALDVFSEMSGFDPKMEALSVNLVKMAHILGTTVVDNTGAFNNVLTDALEYTSKNYGLSKKAILNKIAANDTDSNKTTVGGFVVDTRKLKEKPYHTRESAKKAISDTMFRKVCDLTTGNLRLDKLKKEAELAKSHPLSERVMDNILKSIRWTN